MSKTKILSYKCALKILREFLAKIFKRSYNGFMQCPITGIAIISAIYMYIRKSEIHGRNYFIEAINAMKLFFVEVLCLLGSLRV